MEQVQEQNIKINRLAQRMYETFTPGVDAVQTDEYNELQQQYLWEQHVSREMAKFAIPYYSDHRFG